MTKSDKIVIAMNNLSAKKRNNIKTNVMSSASINCHSKNVGDCYTLHTVLLITITMLIDVSTCCYPIKYRAKHLLPFHK